MEEGVLFLCTGGTIDKCYPRTQVNLNDDDKEDHDDDHHQDFDNESTYCQGGYSFEFGDPAVGEVFAPYRSSSSSIISINEYHHIHRQTIKGGEEDSALTQLLAHHCQCVQVLTLSDSDSDSDCHHYHRGLVINILLKGVIIAVIIVIVIIVLIIIMSIIIINVVRLSLNREDSQDITDDHRNEMLSR